MPWDQVPGLLSQGCGVLVSWYQGSHLYLPLPYVFTCNTILSTSPLYYTFLYRQLVPDPPQDTRLVPTLRTRDMVLQEIVGVWFCKNCVYSVYHQIGRRPKKTCKGNSVSKFCNCLNIQDLGTVHGVPQNTSG